MYRLIALLCASLLFTGCASPTNPVAMVPVDYVPGKIQPYSVSVNVAGGQDTSALGKSSVADADLKTAIEETILKTKAFKQLVKVGGADYELSASILTVNQPTMGFSFTVKTDLAWKLRKVADDNIVWRKVINSQHTTGAGEAFAGVERLRLATEGAIRSNIELALKDIATLEL
ncbi:MULTISPECIES: hypothetical protein [Cellvibrio]|uniref:Lipoprotein n=1 Tax=Cellvibrio fibrivorans TaxID=126350 RepID=A0ABU1V293_9GAMM|nr:hypothetical protein [Cellvibrio fibrivorans]MDR7091520.1 hypothetical protein [Cellvibrio fibrivorans]